MQNSNSAELRPVERARVLAEEALHETVLVVWVGAKPSRQSERLRLITGIRPARYQSRLGKSAEVKTD